MAELFARIWKAPASTATGMILAGLAALLAAWAEAPQGVVIGAAVVIAMLGAFSKGQGRPKGRLPLVLVAGVAMCLALPSCTTLPDGTKQTDPAAVAAYTELIKVVLEDK